jgi:hypothetical protein
LAQYKGALYLNGLSSLSEAAAEALGGHTGELRLYGLTSLSARAAEALMGIGKTRENLGLPDGLANYGPWGVAGRRRSI